ncbi:DUF2142 domain-containing protein [Paenibacillus caseinilyticus]|uniref:DUF2142 domain-containing protein n=1 Tax=Paenibacillus mucilaginosus K02 TaxID=997761 RepID=I0BBC4_9BACL|nr:DUF2142 domain-containing protein [Paenibacillus mucilaginosus]AFH59671.1 hypothetical protein B2K_02840 [Paenibacillus mucilaginosus K02]
MGVSNSHYSPSTLLVKLFLLFGLLYVFIVPPFQMADEDSHFKKAYLVSTLNFFPEMSGGQIGNYLPKAILDFEQKHRYMIGKTDQKFDYTDFQNNSIPVDYSNVVFSQFSTTKTHPILYLPQAIFMFLTRAVVKIIMLGNSDLLTPAVYLYAGRIGNLLFFMWIGRLAIKTIPFYKNLVLMLCIMPMTFSLASSLSYDSMVIGVSLFVTALLLKYVISKEEGLLSRNHILVLCLLSVLLIELKQVYYPILLLFLVIPNNRFKSIKSKLFSFAAIILSGIMSHILWVLVSKAGLGAPETSGVGAQVNFIINNPLEYIMILLRTLSELRFFYLNSFVGNLGWLDTNFPVIFILGYLLILLILSFTDVNRQITLGVKVKLVGIVIFIICFLLVETSLYVTWTSLPQIGGIGHRVVSGVQGRYFIPFVLIILMLFYSPKFKSDKLTYAMPIMLTPVCYFSCIFSLFVVFVRYWVPVS